MNAKSRFLTAAAAATAGLLLCGGTSLAAVAIGPRPRPSPMPTPAPAPRPAPRPAPKPAPKPGNGGGVVVRPGVPAPAAPLPELAWCELEPGLARGKERRKLVVVVFTVKGFKGPATFESRKLRDSLEASEAVPVRVLPPEAPAVPAQATAEERKAIEDRHREALKAYGDLARKYGAVTNPTMLFLDPEGGIVGRLTAPDAGQVGWYLLGLAKAVEAAEEKKAADGKPQATAQQ